MSKKLYVVANANTDDLDPDDEGIEGTYFVEVDEEDDGDPISLSVMASIALDNFHTSHGISVLDDFSIYVIDPDTGEAVEEQDDYQNGSLEHLGEYCEKLNDDVIEPVVPAKSKP